MNTVAATTPVARTIRSNFSLKFIGSPNPLYYSSLLRGTSAKASVSAAGGKAGSSSRPDACRRWRAAWSMENLNQQ
jgi:hypothetical protein